MKSIIVTNLSKKYSISPEKRNSFTQISLKDSLVKLLKKPYKLFSSKVLKRIVMTNKTQKQDFWALSNVKFSVNEGEVLGIIGTNGSGKSTLLKILAGITVPTTGEITLRGKTSSLLSIGLGFHSDLSGRENIYLNGALLGFRKKDIQQELEEIISFSGIGKFIDTPVKHYSSGMYVRLAFSIATSNCMQPDVFFIDEVLSVGDIGFQKKCLKRIRGLVKNHKTSVVIVSHNMEIINNLCDKCILLKNGSIQESGNPKEVIEKYLKILK